jgi:hypothetical protein
MNKNHERSARIAEKHRETEAIEKRSQQFQIPSPASQQEEGKMKMPSQASPMALATEWQFELWNKPTPPASLKSSAVICETVTAPVWKASLGEERLSITFLNLRGP